MCMLHINPLMRGMEPGESCVAKSLPTGEEYRDTAVSPAFNLLLSVRQRGLRYLGHLLRLPHDRVVRITLMAMTGGGNRYPAGSLFMECQGSELKYLETLEVNRTAWRNKVEARKSCVLTMTLYHWPPGI